MCAKSASAGTAEFIGNGILVSVGTDLVLPSPMGNPCPKFLPFFSKSSQAKLTYMIADRLSFYFVSFYCILTKSRIFSASIGVEIGQIALF